MITKTIVVLAKSIKHGKYCIAGKDIITKQWIRPVSDINGAELSEQQCKCTNDDWQNQGKSPYSSSVFKKVEIDLIQHAPLINQPENYIISNNVWKHKYNIKDCEIKDYLDNPTLLWGSDDKIPYAKIENKKIVISQSLYLIKADNLNLFMNGSNKRRLEFIYNGITYTLPVTDPNFDNLLQTNNQYKRGILCVSLGEKFFNEYDSTEYCYKIVATIFI